MSKELAKTYDPKGIEDRLYQKWLERKYFHAEADHTKNTFHYCNSAPKYHGTVAHGSCS